VRERKGEDEGDAWLTYQQRREKGKQERKVAAGGLAIDGRRLCGVKEQEEGGKTARNGSGLVMVVYCLNWCSRRKGKVEEAGRCG
jgi:hypothetical protein